MWLPSMIFNVYLIFTPLPPFWIAFLTGGVGFAQGVINFLVYVVVRGLEPEYRGPLLDSLVPTNSG